MNPSVEEIWNEFASQLERFIRARVGKPEVAEDIRQEVFLKLQGAIAGFRDPAKLQGWLILVARNAIIDYYRTQKKASELPESLAADFSGHETESEELRVVFHRLLHSLPEQFREALILTEFEGLTQEALAKRLGISLSGAKSRVQRGREQLKELLLDYCHQEFSRAIGSQPCPKGLLPIVQSGKRTAKQPSSRAKAKRTR
jgi:RNA polymerase sigma-70 factor, ECF subfamily